MKPTHPQRKTIGIVGGLGPQASCELYRLVNEKSCAPGRATGNADFPHLLINSLAVPDLVDDTESEQQTVAIVRAGAFALERAGATDILMACNTIHVFQNRIIDGLGTRLHSLIDLVADAAQGARKVLVLGSRTTLRTQLYQNALRKRGLSFAEPSAELLDRCVAIILATIGQRATTTDREAFVEQVRREAAQDPEIDTIALACTELPLVFPPTMQGFRLLNSLNEAAEHIMSLHFADINQR